MGNQFEIRNNSIKLSTYKPPLSASHFKEKTETSPFADVTP